MISQKISRMRTHLQSIGLDVFKTEDLVEQASEDINESLKQMVSQAVREAAMAGEEMDADEFLREISLDADSGYVQISTDSGRLDFSEPPTPMLPWLLKNAKTAKDGSRYKVIPVGGQSQSKPGKQVKDIDSAIANIAAASSMADMAADVARQFGMAPMFTKKGEPSKPGSVSFRVASSKQDQNTQWVLPAKDKNLTSTIMDINFRLRGEIDRMTDEVIDRYVREAEDIARNM